MCMNHHHHPGMLTAKIPLTLLTIGPYQSSNQDGILCLHRASFCCLTNTGVSIWEHCLWFHPYFFSSGQYTLFISLGFLERWAVSNCTTAVFRVLHPTTFLSNSHQDFSPGISLKCKWWIHNSATDPGIGWGKFLFYSIREIRFWFSCLLVNNSPCFTYALCWHHFQQMWYCYWGI